MQLSTVVYASFKSLWEDKNIKIDVKMQLLVTCVSVLLYAAETWTLKKDDDRILVY